MRPTFLTVDQLAERWQLSTETIYGRIYKGRSLPPFVKLGNAVRFRLADVERFEDQHTVGAA
jgi:excisionase family DNA binding protein